MSLVLSNLADCAFCAFLKNDLFNGILRDIDLRRVLKEIDLLGQTLRVYCQLFDPVVVIFIKITVHFDTLLWRPTDKTGRPQMLGFAY